MRTTIKYFAVALVLATGLFACNSTKKESQSTETSMNTVTPDSMKLRLIVADIDSMSVLFTENEKTALIDISDRTKLAELLSTARYDTVWNKGDIMVKMVAQDYTIISRYKNKSQDENGWLMIWKENGRTKFNNKWFFIPDENHLKVYELLDKYR